MAAKFTKRLTVAANGGQSKYLTVTPSISNTLSKVNVDLHSALS